MYISVIPLGNSFSRYPSLYFVPEIWQSDIRVGYLVEIPIGKQITLGVIDTLSPSEQVHPDIEIRAIVRIVATQDIIAPYMISMIRETALFYFLPIHKVACMFLPAPLLTRLDKKNYLIESEDGIREKNQKKIQGSFDIHHYVDKIFSSDDLSRYLMPSTVFIFPDDIALALFYRSLAKSVQENIGYHPYTQTSAKRSGGWIDIYTHKDEIIFGTRRLLYYNLSAYDRIIYIEDAFTLEQFAYPIRIRYLDILASLSRTSHHDIILISSTPTLHALTLFKGCKILPIRHS